MPGKVTDPAKMNFLYGKVNDEGMSYSEAAEAFEEKYGTSISKSSVKNALDRRDGITGEEREPDPEHATESVVASGDEPDDDDFTYQDLRELGPGEFMRRFWEQYGEGFGVSEQFQNLRIKQAKHNGQIPDEEKMKTYLQQQNSGIGNESEADSIAEIYWSVASKWAEVTAGTPGQQPIIEREGAGAGGGFVGGQQQGFSPQQGQQGFEPQQGAQGYGTQQNQGSFVGPGPQPPQQGQQPDSMQMMYQMMQQQQRQFQQMLEQTQMENQSGPSEADVLRDELAQLREEMDSGPSEVDILQDELAALRDEMTEDNSGGMAENVKELVEMKETLDALTGDDDDSVDQETKQALGALTEQINDIRRQINESDDDDDGLGFNPELLSNTNSEIATIAMLANSGGMDGNALSSIAEMLDDSDEPAEVQTKRIEKSIAEQKMKHRQEMIDGVLDNADELVDGLLGTFAGEFDADETTDEQPRSQERPDRQQRQVASRPTPAQEMVKSETATAEPETAATNDDAPGTESSPDASDSSAEANGHIEQVTDEATAEDEQTPDNPDAPAETNGHAEQAQDDDDADHVDPEELDNDEVALGIYQEVQERGWDTEEWPKFMSDASEDGYERDTISDMWQATKRAQELTGDEANAQDAPGPDAK